jgi:Spy/CpxP family protein refolding chaperone
MVQRPSHPMMVLGAVVAVSLMAAGAVAVRAGSGFDGGVLARLHRHLGGGAMPGLPQQLEQIVQKLNLNPEQQAHVDRAHAIIESHLQQSEQGHTDEMNAFVASIGEGTLDRAQVRSKIDAHLEQARTVAYDVSDELVGLVSSLDANQRAILKDELTKLHESMR